VSERECEKGVIVTEEYAWQAVLYWWRMPFDNPAIGVARLMTRFR
jgi:hypothetical protein